MGGKDECGPYPRTRYSINSTTQQDTPRNKQYSLEQNRFKSFKEKNWPKGLTQTPEQLANAGFYYLGKGDQVLCFYCKGGLQDWESNDDPWEEHAKHFPTCGFLNVTKSPDYVRNIHENLRRTSIQSCILTR